jgi:hypothetical protein
MVFDVLFLNFTKNLKNKKFQLIYLLLIEFIPSPLDPPILGVRTKQLPHTWGLGG